MGGFGPSSLKMAQTRYKVMIGEIDGADLSRETELALDGKNVFYDNTTSGLAAENLDAAIDEVNASSAGSGISNYFDEESSSSTSSSTYQTKLSENTTSLTTGNYIVHYSVELLSSHKEIQARVTVDSTQIGEFNPADVDKLGTKFVGYSGFKKMNLTGVVPLLVEWNNGGMGTASIRSVRIYFEKI